MERSSSALSADPTTFSSRFAGSCFAGEAASFTLMWATELKS